MLGGCDSGGARICLRKEQKEARGRDSAPVQPLLQSSPPGQGAYYTRPGERRYESRRPRREGGRMPVVRR